MMSPLAFDVVLDVRRRGNRRAWTVHVAWHGDAGDLFVVEYDAESNNVRAVAARPHIREEKLYISI